MRDELMRRWRSLSSMGRSLLVLGVLVLAIGTASAAWWVLREDQQVLFSGLSAQDAAAVTRELDRQKLPYSLADDGGTILMAADAVHKTRLKLMASGGPALQGTVGFEMFNNADFGMTDFAQRVNYQRAMQGELQRTILSLAEVASARVHLVLPEGGLFRKGQARPKASVTLGLKAPLKPAQTLSIQRLVAAAVPEMEPEAVTVVDQQGNTLSRLMATDDEPAAGARIEAKRQAEAYVRQKVVEVMDRALGAGRAIVTVDVVLNADRVRYTKEELLPGATVKRRESLQSSGGTLPAEAPAAKPGKPADAGQPADSTGHTVEVEYANGRKLEQGELASGTISKLSVGVLVPAGADATELSKLREMAAMAVGLNQARGDALAINTIELPQAGGAAQPAAPEMAQALRPPAPVGLPSPMLVSWLSAAAFTAAILAVVARMRRREARKAQDLTPAQREALFEDVRRWALESAERRPAAGG
jgi:flagellar M-ring protein FliF